MTLGRIVREIKVLFASRLGEPDVFVALRDDVVVRKRAVRVFAVQEFAAGRAVQQVFAVRERGSFAARDAGERGQDVAQFAQTLHAPVRVGSGDDQRHVGAAAVGKALAVQVMVAQHLAMIAGEHDDGVGGQRFEQAANLVIEMRDAGVVADLRFANHRGIRWAGIGILLAAMQTPRFRVVPVAGERRGDLLAAVEVEVAGGRVERRMRADVGHVQEKRHRVIPAAQEIERAVGNPVRRMVFFLVRPRARDPRIALYAAVVHVPQRAQLVFEPVQIVVRPRLIFAGGGVLAAVIMKIAVVQLDVVKAHQTAQRVHVHLAHALRVVAQPRQLAGQRVFIAPRHAVAIAHAAMVLLRKSGQKRRARRDAGRAGGVHVRKVRAVRGERIQIGRFYVRVPGNAKAVAAKLVGDDQHDIRSVHEPS